MRPWIRWTSRIVIAIVAIAALLALPKLLTAVPREITQAIPPLSLGMIIVVAVEAALLLLAAIWWVWWWVPKWQMRSVTAADPKEQADIEDNFRKTVGQALGGIAVLVGAVMAYLQFTQQQRAAHDLLISNQVAKGFEQLASDKATMRLGGIYALEGVMKIPLRITISRCLRRSAPSCATAPSV